MKKFDVHKIIEDQDKERKEQIKQRVFSQIDYPATKEKPKKRFYFKWAALAATSVCALCIAVVVPVLFGGGGEPDDNGRYCSQDDYVLNIVDYTLKDYGHQNNLDIKYFDWYDIAEDYVDFVFVNKNDETDVFCFEETLVIGDNYDMVTLYVTDNRTTIDFLELYNDWCNDSYVYNGVNIKLGQSDSNAYAKFEYKKFRYYVRLDVPQSKNVLIEYTKELIR